MSFSSGCPYNRRSYPRWSVRLSIHYATADSRSVGEIINLSAGGLAFVGETIHARGASLTVQFRLTDGTEISAVGVVRSQNGNILRIEFKAIPISERLRIVEHFCTRRS